MRKILAVLWAAAVVALFWPWSATRANSLLLDATTKSLEMETSGTASTDYVVSYADHTASAFTPGMNQGNVASATTTTILSAPGASTQRQVKWVSIRNRSTSAAQTVTLKLDVSATEYHVAPAVTLGPGEALRMDAEGDLVVFTSSGVERTLGLDPTGYSGRVFAWAKAGTAKDAAGYWYAYGKDNGFPGAYSLGTPGLNGTATDCSGTAATTGAGALGTNLLSDAATGSYYLTSVVLSNTVVELTQLVDLLWYNTGLTVTTTTGQAITPAALPARDINGSTNGDGVYAALLATAALGNAGVISNTTITYTDSDGNASNTGTFAALVGWQAPATPVIGTWMPFQLAAGDRGVRSVQTVTLGTTYTSGSMSLVLFRPLASVAHPTASVGGIQGSPQFFTAPGVRIYNDTCVWTLAVGGSAAANIQGTYTIVER